MTLPLPTANNILGRLNSGVLQDLLGYSDHVVLERGDTIIRGQSVMNYAYFPLSGMISLVLPMAEGQLAEVGVAGRETFVGFEPVLGVTEASADATVQVSVEAIRIKSAELIQAANRYADFRNALFRAVYMRYLQVSYTAACNAHHTAAERLARWLLMADDRIEGHEIHISHEFLAIMLGIRRAGVTVAMAGLKSSGVVSASRGLVTIEDRRGLEAASCSCYRALHETIDRVIR